MRIAKAPQGKPRPDIEVEADDALSLVAEWRGLPVELLARYGVRVDDHETHPIVFPYPNLIDIWYERRRAWIDDGRANKYLSPKGSSPHLYNPLHLGPNASQVWLCEGEFDTLTLIHYGLPAVGVAGTGAFNRKWVHLYSGAEVVVAFDGDQAGLDSGKKLVEAFKEKRARVFQFVPGDDDVNGLHLAGLLVDTLSAFADDYGITLEGAGVEGEQSEDGGSQHAAQQGTAEQEVYG